MIVRSDAKLSFIFYFTWVVLMLLQAYFTELSADEAYYWMYSRRMAWGYFDHPPLIAVCIRLGSYILPGELGVRLVPVLLTAITIFLTELIAKPSNKIMFYMIVSSVAILHYVGFMAIPDAPLLLGVALVLYLYKRFLLKPAVPIAIALGVASAFICLSKYHAIIVLTLLVISNVRLVKTKEFWIALITACLILFPHILWQVNMNFPSVKFHLTERSPEVYSFSHTLNFIVSQLYVFGPFMGILFLFSGIIQHHETQFGKSIKYLFWGGLIIITILSFKGHTEPHWTLFTLIPAILISYKWIEATPKVRKLLQIQFPVAIALILASRLIIASDYIQNVTVFHKATKTFNNRSKMKAIKEMAEDHPVAFMNSYQQASLYTFYTDSEGFSMSNIMGRKSQFDLWNVDETYRGEDVLVISNFFISEFDSIDGLSPPVSYQLVENFQLYSSVRVIPLNLPFEAYEGDTLEVLALLISPLDGTFSLKENPKFPVRLEYVFRQNGRYNSNEVLMILDDEDLNKEIEFRVVVPKLPGKYELNFGLKAGWFPPSINSKRYDIKVSNHDLN